MSALDVAALRARIDGFAGEWALIDVREEGEYGAGHLLRAVNAPYSGLERLIGALVPRSACPIVLVDGGDGVAVRAACRLGQQGYAQVQWLDGGMPAWAAAGFGVFEGTFVPSKAFGEWTEHHHGTPAIEAAQLAALQHSGADVAVLDPRSVAEHVARHVPGAIACPGGELVYRFADLVPSPDTFVVVACGGRTRGIVGAQTLIDAGVPNRVAALADGVHGWGLAGFAVEEGLLRAFGPASAAGAAAARERAARLRAASAIPVVDAATLATWTTGYEPERRTTYMLDVRTPEEYLAGHLPHSRSAPGGQLVQATDRWIGTLGARLVLIDDDGVRATLAAHWLRRMHWDAWVLDHGSLPAAVPAAGPAGHAAHATGSRAADAAACVAVELSDRFDAAAPELEPVQAFERLRQPGAVAVSFDTSDAFLHAHPPGARWASRARLAPLEPLLREGRTLVLFSADAGAAQLAARDLIERAAELEVPPQVWVVHGGQRNWAAHGLPLEPGTPESLPAEQRIDTLYWGRGRRSGDAAAMRAYLAWERQLLAQTLADEPAFPRRPAAPILPEPA